MHTIKWGIIGCGDVTEVKSGPAFRKVTGSDLVAVMRRDAARAEDYARRHGVPRWYSEADALINDPEVNAIYVATPPLYHEAYTIQALKAGKPVYVEKPMAVSAAAARNMAACAAREGGKLCVAHYRREQPLFKKIRQLLLEEAIGRVQLVNLRLLLPHQSKVVAATEANWRINEALSGGGLFHDLAPHQLDLMYHFFGPPMKAGGLALNQGGFYTAADTVCGQAVFDRNILLQGTWSFTVPPEHKEDRVEILGTKGKISFSVFEHQDLQVTAGGTETRYSFDKLAHVQEPMIATVVRYFLGEAENPCPAEEGVAVMQLMEAFASANGR